MITVTDSAKKQLDEILMDDVSMKYVRAFITGGGCSGFNYGFTLDEEVNEDDFEIALDEFKVVVDGMSMTYLTGSEIDYSESTMGSSFNIKNPNANSTCGCGSSFSVGQDFHEELG